MLPIAIGKDPLLTGRSMSTTTQVAIFSGTWLGRGEISDAAGSGFSIVVNKT
jgi:hypothetical protein